MGKKYFDEGLVLEIANRIPSVNARFSTLEEDCGHRKADVVLSHQGTNYFVQVSKQPKSKRHLRVLSRRGTHAVHTCDFYGREEPQRIMQDLKNLII